MKLASLRHEQNTASGSSSATRLNPDTTIILSRFTHSSILLVHCLLLLSLVSALQFTAVDSAAPTTTYVLRTVSGRAVSSALVRKHVPHATADILPHLLWERLPSGALVSLTSRLDVDILAPRVYIPDVSATRVVIDGIVQPPLPRGPTLRIGLQHAFAFDFRTNALLAAWGPTLDLRPLHSLTHPNIFVNARHNITRVSLHLKSHHDHHRSNSSSQSVIREQPWHRWKNNDMATVEREGKNHFQPNWKAENNIFFDVSFAFDASFCAAYARGGADNVTQVVHAVGVAAHQMALSPIVSVRIGDIVGSCSWANDAFARPSDLNSCNGHCSRPGRILRDFRVAWAKEAINVSVADAVYLMTGYDDGTSVVGAAWVAAACHPRYAFGWAEGAHPVILAHEIAHTLGAPHDPDSGLMQPSLDLNATEVLSPRSLRHIQAYITRLDAADCLAARHVWTNNGRRQYTAFTRITRGPEVEGTDVALGAVSGDVADVVMLFVNHFKGPDPHALYLSFSRIVRQPANGGFPFSLDIRNMSRFSRVRHSTGAHTAGAGLALTSLRFPSQKDIAVVFLSDRGVGRYVIGYNFNGPKGGARGYSMLRRIPVDLGSDVRCLGATFGNVRGKGPVDLVVVYIRNDDEQLKAYYVVGFGFDRNGHATEGWRGPEKIDWEVGVTQVGDISVGVHNIAGAKTIDLVIGYTRREAKLWAHKFVVGLDINQQGIVTSGWRPIMADMEFNPSSDLRRLTGGFALGHIASQQTTAIVYQCRHFDTGNTLWLEIGDGMLSNKSRPNGHGGSGPRPEFSQVDIRTPLQTCAECYPQTDRTAQCRHCVHDCFARRASFALSTVTAARSMQTGRENNSTAFANSPDVKSIFCEGFHELYVSGGDACRWDAEPVDIVSAGSMASLLSDLRQYISSSTNDHNHYQQQPPKQRNWTNCSSSTINITNPSTSTNPCSHSSNYANDDDNKSEHSPSSSHDDSSDDDDELSAAYSTSYGEVPEKLRYITPGGSSGHFRVPKTVHVTFQSGRFVRKDIIQRAIAKLKRRQDFSKTFTTTGLQYQVRRNGKYRFVVIIKFSDKYQEAFLTAELKK